MKRPTVQDALFDSLKEQYPGCRFVDYCDKIYMITDARVVTLQLLADLIRVDNDQLEWTDPRLIQRLCGKIFDALHVRPIDPTFTV